MFVYSNRNSNPLGNIGCLIFGVLGLVALFYILRGLYYLLWFAAPVLFIVALIINWRVVANTGKALLSLLGRNPLAGILMAILAVVGFPILSLYLVMAAIGAQRVADFQQQFGGAPFENQAREKEDGFVEFEEIETTPIEDMPLNPPPDAEKSNNESRS